MWDWSSGKKPKAEQERSHPQEAVKLVRVSSDLGRHQLRIVTHTSSGLLFILGLHLFLVPLLLNVSLALELPGYQKVAPCALSLGKGQSNNSQPWKTI